MNFPIFSFLENLSNRIAFWKSIALNFIWLFLGLQQTYFALHDLWYYQNWLHFHLAKNLCWDALQLQPFYDIEVLSLLLQYKSYFLTPLPPHALFHQQTTLKFGRVDKNFKIALNCITKIIVNSGPGLVFFNFTLGSEKYT